MIIRPHSLILSKYSKKMGCQACGQVTNDNTKDAMRHAFLGTPSQNIIATHSLVNIPPAHATLQLVRVQSHAHNTSICRPSHIGLGQFIPPSSQISSQKSSLSSYAGAVSSSLPSSSAVSNDAGISGSATKAPRHKSQPLISSPTASSLASDWSSPPPPSNPNPNPNVKLVGALYALSRPCNIWLRHESCGLGDFHYKHCANELSGRGGESACYCTEYCDGGYDEYQRDDWTED